VHRRLGGFIGGRGKDGPGLLFHVPRPTTGIFAPPGRVA